MPKQLSNKEFYDQIIDLLVKARKKVVHTINRTMVGTYFEIGKRIVENEQGGKERAAYGKAVIKTLSKVLTKEFGKGFSERNLEQMRQFYLVYSKPQTLSAESKNRSQTPSAESKKTRHDFKLSWSHYLTLMRMDNPNERKFYEIESDKNKWSVRELKRQYDSALYTRLVLSGNQDRVKELSEKGLVLDNPKDAVKDPYILEFLGLPEKSEYSENQLDRRVSYSASPRSLE